MFIRIVKFLLLTSSFDFNSPVPPSALHEQNVQFYSFSLSAYFLRKNLEVFFYESVGRNKKNTDKT